MGGETQAIFSELRAITSQIPNSKLVRDTGLWIMRLFRAKMASDRSKLSVRPMNSRDSTFSMIFAKMIRWPSQNRNACSNLHSAFRRMARNPRVKIFGLRSWEFLFPCKSILRTFRHSARYYHLSKKFPAGLIKRRPSPNLMARSFLRTLFLG